MAYVSVHRFNLFGAILLMCSNVGLGQSLPASSAALRYASASASSDSSYSVSSTGWRPLNLIGTYRPDGSFRPIMSGEEAAQALIAQPNAPDQSVVPRSFFASSNETVVENVIPPNRVNHGVRGHSIFALLRDNLVTFAYGHPRVLSTPTHVITDSRGRLIVSDPESASIHVLEASGKTSFRISGGPARRLQSPGAIAVDGNDNIYVADEKLGLISVFDPSGRFLRYLGAVQGESMFDSPAAIAIHRKSGRLYVLDANADELIVLDLQGKVLKRVGREHSQTSVRLRHPSEITIARDEVVVLDRFGARIQTLDLDCNLKNSFALRSENGAPVTTEVGLALDSHLQIYISNLMSSAVRVYSHDGDFLGFMGRSSEGQNFNKPLGLWVDSSDRLYVSDSNNSRIQVFQLANGETAVPAARN